MELTAYWSEYAAEFDRARAGIDPRQIAALLGWVEEARVHGRHVFILGNGGSAASAAHWACDLGKGASVGLHRRLAALAPNEQVGWHTALANDVSYADALAEQLRNWVGPGDLIVALSVSGDSENLVRACAVGRRAHATVVAIVGAAGGRLAACADLAIVIPSRDYGVVEDLHMTINHVISQFLRDRLREQAAPADDDGDWEARIAGLEPGEAALLRSRFGLDDGIRRTLADVASEHGVTLEQVRAAERRLLGRGEGAR